MMVVRQGTPAAVSAPLRPPAGLGSQPGHCSSRRAWPRRGPGTLKVPGPGWPAVPPAKGAPDR
jgi:hypothetical protein